MGIGNFFDNFIGGLAFGMLANNPFYRGMCCCGYGFGSMPSMNRVDFGTFANGFPNVFGDMNYIPNTPQISLFNDFGNAGFPTLDYAKIGQSILDYTFNPDSEYNKRLKEYYNNLSNNNTSANYCGQSYFKAYDMPFSPFYLPTQIPYGGYMPQYQAASISPLNTAEIKTNTDAQTSQKDETSLEPQETDSDSLKDKKNNYNITELKSIWSKKKNLPDAFYDKVIHISKKINCNPNDLMGVMWVESAKTFSPSARNPHGSATGLIQFMPNTAKTLGTTIDKLSKMTAVEQLEYVEKYLIANKSAAGYDDNDTIDRGTLYSLVFLPGRSKRAVLTTKGENYYDQNTVLDYNNDGKITKADLDAVITANIA